MKTEDLVTMLARGPSAAAPNLAVRRYAAALAGGTAVSAGLMAVLLGVRPDLAHAFLLPMFWIKLAFVSCLAAASAIVTLRLSRPGSRTGMAAGALLAPVLAVWALAAFALVTADAGRRDDLLFGQTWKTCSLFIAALAVPVFAAGIWAMRGLAPTRLRLAGAAAGVAAGSLAALVYSWHCTEMAAPFLAVWYLLGALIPAGAGALLGPRLLRW